MYLPYLSFNYTTQYVSTKCLFYISGVRNLHIYTDSQFLINCITKWIYKWKKNNWSTIAGKPVINKVELVELDNSINEYMDSVIWVRVILLTHLELMKCYMNHPEWC